jgi:predicted CopG family antitoxin
MATTIQVHESTKEALERLKAGRQSYDDVIQALLQERSEHDPWLEEMARRMGDVKSGKEKLLPQSVLEEYHKKRMARMH